MLDASNLTLDAVDILTLSFASASLVISSLLAIWSMGRQKRFHTFDIISAAHARLHRVARDTEMMKRQGRFEVTEVLAIVREADEAFATVDPYLKLSRWKEYSRAAEALAPGHDLQVALENGDLETWLGLGRDAIRRYLRLS